MKEHSNCGIGVVANIDNRPEHQVVREGIKILNRLEHRGGTLRDGSGDGAGIMTQIPRDFYKKVAGIEGNYYLAMTFLPRDEKKRLFCEEIIADEIRRSSLIIKGERSVPVREAVLGESARRSLPYIYQYFIDGTTDDFIIYSTRRRIEKRIYETLPKNEFYFVSFSDKTVVHKGLITPKQFNVFYQDLLDVDFKSATVMVHQRFSTNTLPSWDLAHPFRVLEHNGEINTIAGNRNWIESRSQDTYSQRYSKDTIEGLFPLTSDSNSDSANLDSLIEFMMHTGRKLPEIMTTLVPQAWEDNPLLPERLKKYYTAKSLVMEPWDGPAGLIASNGDEIFATLDRNGLRPMRYTITTDNKLIISSEMGVLDTEFSKVKVSGKLSAGEFLYLDLNKKRLLEKDDILEIICSSTNYESETNNLKIHKRRYSSGETLKKDEVEKLMNRFSYTREDVDVSIDHVADNGVEKVASGAYDIPLAVLDEENPRLFSDYFRQKFAQVTNPPIDPIRESSVFSLTSNYGPKKNLLDHREDRGTIHMYSSPVLTNKDIEALKEEGARTVSTGFTRDLETAIESVVGQCLNLACGGINIILSDRGTTRSIPVLLIASAVHHRLIEAGYRNRIGLAVESGEIREINHYALLIGYGIDVINPYLVLDYLTVKKADISGYLRGADKGIKKIMSKMGISSLASYRGAKIFEVIGLKKDLCNRYLGGTPSIIEGLGLEEIEKELLKREEISYTTREITGEFSSGRGHLKHKDSYDNIKILHQALANKSYDEYREYSTSIYRGEYSLRNLLTIKNDPISIDEVEREDEIMKRFVAGAMSFGALSEKAHENIATVFNLIGAMSNSGEGGEDPERFKDNRISQVKQIASGRFGVTTNYLMNARELQIKMGQGAKPGEGGHLPGSKVNKKIAMVRNTIEGIDLISPPPHHDIYSIEDLAQLIYDVKNLNTSATVSVKLASVSGVGIIASGTVKAGADKVVISGSEGGTGAALTSSLKYTATPWELGISDTHRVLCENNLRDLVKIQGDGGLRTGYDILVAALMGADEFALGTGLLLAQRCIMCRRCHTNSCPMGLTTQKAELQDKYQGDPAELLLYLRFIAREIRELLASIGAKSLEDIIGKTSLLIKKKVAGYKKSQLDFTEMLKEAERNTSSSSHPRDINFLNKEIVAEYTRGKRSFDKEISNIHRTFGATLGGVIQETSSDNTSINLRGYAGQSFGAFTVKGQRIILEGYANDYVAKGLSGGVIAVKKPSDSKSGGCIAGNTVLYGATSGDLYLNGSAGERFAVRNSGANCVVEGIGNHGCEYMTGGNVIVLGDIGANFGAGMSGGIAYLMENSLESNNVNRDSVEFFEVDARDENFIKLQLENHVKFTGSEAATSILRGDISRTFIKVASRNYLIKTGRLNEDDLEARDLLLKEVNEKKAL